MPSLSSAVCLKCEKIYDSTTRKICSGTLCSHSICEPCFDEKKSSTCPTCGKPDSYATKNINYQAMELLDRLKEDMSLKAIMEENSYSDCESLSKGLCCECNKYYDKLRLCVSCSLESNLLVKLENGDIKMTTETNGELLETKILRLKSSAFCANCVLDKNIHMGHSIVLVKDVKGLANNTTISNALSVVALSLHQIKEKTECMSEEGKAPIRFMEFVNQIEELFITTLAGGLKINSNTATQKTVDLGSKFLLRLHGTLGKMKFFEDLLSECDNEIESAETAEEKMTLQKMKELSYKLRDLLNTAGDLSKLGPDDYQQITEILESGPLQTIIDHFKSDKRRMPTEEEFQGLMTMAKDIKRTIPFKIPPQYDKYADLAGSCFKAFFG
ncbi:hypothetical protein B9Z55_013016 [Caenorhabditis nigoni]|uniref:RING-type domain-containing protein n=1 Tax=Caenorhabditis nigoni TaxID=1611254 RepID=A0A2G5TZZ5_9PELO|nr:hypothetical protein B9Z55_013016 [Caenorhabditis nigoni]